MVWISISQGNETFLQVQLKQNQAQTFMQQGIHGKELEFATIDHHQQQQQQEQILQLEVCSPPYIAAPVPNQSHNQDNHFRLTKRG